MKKFLKGTFSIATIVGVALLFVAKSYACTDFRIIAKDGSVVVARTMEWDILANANLRTANRNQVYQGRTPNGVPGLTWKGKYGYVYLDALGLDVVVDGMNEKGLSFQYLMLPGFTKYQNVPSGEEGRAISHLQLGEWILSNFSTVDEVSEALPSIFVYGESLAKLGGMVVPLHAAVYDAQGRGIVIEYVDGKLNIHENTLGVLTNSPPYDWQIINLRNYVNLSPMNPDPIKVRDMMVPPTGAGAGMLGLPGDITPPSRFVRIAMILSSALQPANAEEALILAQHVVNTVDIPLGFVGLQHKNGTSYELTQYAIFLDQTNRVFYYRTYNNLTLKSISLDKIDFYAGSPRLKMPIQSTIHIMDETERFTNSVVK